MDERPSREDHPGTYLLWFGVLLLIAAVLPVGFEVLAGLATIGVVLATPVLIVRERARRR
jgi:membrane protein implicated in regulation of membrane protease activity